MLRFIHKAEWQRTILETQEMYQEEEFLGFSLLQILHFIVELCN